MKNLKELNDLAYKWRGEAAASREEAGRIRRTAKAATDAEANCLVRAEVWDKCASELNVVIGAMTPPIER